MVYTYIRVSTDKQHTYNQKFEIERYLIANNISNVRWVEEVISGTKKTKDRKLGKLLKKMKKDDILIVSEISRLGRDLLNIMNILHYAMDKDIKIIAIKENYSLGNDINSKVLAFAFGLSAEIERKLISSRTKEALAKRKADGIVLGRPRSKECLKLSEQKDLVFELMKSGAPKTQIIEKLGVKRASLYNFLKRNNFILPIDKLNELQV
jgi:serine type site-specific recombinase